MQSKVLFALFLALGAASAAVFNVKGTIDGIPDALVGGGAQQPGANPLGMNAQAQPVFIAAPAAPQTVLIAPCGLPSCANSNSQNANLAAPASSTGTKGLAKNMRATKKQLRKMVRKLRKVIRTQKRDEKSMKKENTRLSSEISSIRSKFDSKLTRFENSIQNLKDRFVTTERTIKSTVRNIPRGPRGAPGPAGPVGRIGPQGPAGRPGNSGPRGPQGPAGRDGRAGMRGPAGANGAAGKPGAPGKNGAAGAPGKNGAVGARGPPGAAGARGPPGPQGPAGAAGKTVVLKPQTLRHPPEPVTKLATLTTGLSWEDSETICASNGLSLCTYKTLCYNGKPSENDFYTHQGLGWVPYGGDGNNAWLYLGNSPNAFCKTHPQLANGQRPGWGNVADRGGHHGPLYCCGNKPVKQTPKLIGWSYAMSWQDTSNACEANGMHLCNYLSVCPKGPDNKPWDNKYWVTPVGYDDTWTPIGGEGNNMWIMLGKRHWPICYRHTEIAGGPHGRPGWGAVRDRGGHHGPILCCGGKDKIEETHLLAKKSSGMSWAETSAMCKKNEMHLCNFDSLCPNGWGKAPVVPRRGFDDWIPFDDNQGPGSYLQIGQPWPTCYRHSEVNGGPYGRPGWGNDRSTYPFKGEVFCCGKKPKPAQRLNIGSSAGSTWADANSKCMQRQKKLCTFNDICPNGPETVPIMGKKHGDTWIPIDDAGDNMWLQIGNAGWPACMRHTEIANGIHGRPGWGNQRGREGWHGPIYCC